MNPTHRILLVLPGLLGLGSCLASNESPIELLHVFPLRATAEGCLADPEVAPVDGVFMDVTFVDSLPLGLKIRNNLPNNESESDDRLNTNNFVMKRVELRYEAPDLGLDIAPTEIDTSGTLEAGATNGHILRAIPIPVREQLVNDLPDDPSVRVALVVTAKITGDLRGGDAITSSEIRIPIEVCRGCSCPDCDVAEGESPASRFGPANCEVDDATGEFTEFPVLCGGGGSATGDNECFSF